MKAVNENRILNSMVSAIVHKSIEKTQKFNYFWVSKWVCLQYAKAFSGFSASGLLNDCEPPPPMLKHARAA